MTDRRGHPKESIRCTCGTSLNDWGEDRTLPQLGTTYECRNCGREVYVYDSGGQNVVKQVWREVRPDMVRRLLFYDHVGRWPDSELSRLLNQGLSRSEAIDYYMTESHGLTQSEWAAEVGISQPTVSEHVSKAIRTLDSTDGSASG